MHLRALAVSVVVVLLAACGPAPTRNNNNGIRPYTGPATDYSKPPPGQGGPATVATLEGQDWGGNDGGERVNFYFRKNGVLHYRDPQGWWEDGTWTQNGTLVILNVSDGFATYQGRLSGEVISGTASNKKGKTWNFEIRRGTPRQPAQVDLTGQMWGGTESNQFVVFYFKAGGVLEYDTPQGYFDDGTWEVDGNWVYFKLTGDKLEYFGSIDGDHMFGNAWSPENKRWAWDVTKGQNTNPKSGGGGQVPTTDGIEGTSWEGDNGGDWMMVRFDAGNKLYAKDNAGEYTGTWYQSGTSVTFEMYDRYIVYEATLTGAVMKGTGKRKDGETWQFEFRKK